MLTSPRLLRRIRWLVLVAALAGGVVGLMFLFPSGKPVDTPLRDEPAQTVAVEQEVHASATELQGALDTGIEFVKTAVVRKHLGHSYDLASPELRQGMSRSEWKTGNIPVVPFPALTLADFKIDWTERNDIGLDFVLQPKPGTGFQPKSFIIELKRSSKAAPWRVSGWQPRGISSSTLDPPAEASGTPGVSQSLGTGWLFLPLGVVGLLLFGLAAVGGRAWYRSAQAMRDYRSTLN